MRVVEVLLEGGAAPPRPARPGTAAAGGPAGLVTRDRLKPHCRKEWVGVVGPARGSILHSSVRSCRQLHCRRTGSRWKAAKDDIAPDQAAASPASAEIISYLGQPGGFVQIESSFG